MMAEWSSGRTATSASLSHRIAVDQLLIHFRCWTTEYNNATEKPGCPVVPLLLLLSYLPPQWIQWSFGALLSTWALIDVILMTMGKNRMQRMGVRCAVVQLCPVLLLYRFRRMRSFAIESCLCMFSIRTSSCLPFTLSSHWVLSIGLCVLIANQVGYAVICYTAVF